MKVLLIILALCGLNLSAKDHLTYRFGNQRVLFHQVDGQVVNFSCKDQKCHALKRYHQYKDKDVEVSSGKNPSAVKCKEILTGKVLIGVDEAGNEQSFCYFPDGSYLK